MNKIPYQKPHASYEAQIEKMVSRGLIVQDKEHALKILSNISYYRLGVYSHSFEQDHSTHQFITGTTFEQIVSLYEFDRKLRLLVLDALERIEVSFRTQWVYHMSAHYGSHAHLNEKAHTKYWKHTCEELTRELKRSDEEFIRRSIAKYDSETPPIWAVSEIMSFGLMSKWYKNLRVSSVRKDVARLYQVHPDILESWMQHLSVVRNTCAHHSRLWNRRFERIAPAHTHNHRVLQSSYFADGHPLSNSLLIIVYLLDIIEPANSWRSRFFRLLDSCSVINYGEMGFTDGWRELEMWKEK